MVHHGSKNNASEATLREPNLVDDRGIGICAYTETETDEFRSFEYAEIPGDNLRLAREDNKKQKSGNEGWESLVYRVKVATSGRQKEAKGSRPRTAFTNKRNLGSIAKRGRRIVRNCKWLRDTDPAQMITSEMTSMVLSPFAILGAVITVLNDKVEKKKPRHPVA